MSNSLNQLGKHEYINYQPPVIPASRLIWLEKCYFWFCFSTQTLCRLVLWFLAATAALEVQMLVCLCVTLVWFGGLCLDISWQKWSSILICQNCFFYIQRLHQAWSWCWDLRLFFTRTRIREWSEVYLCAQMKWILKILLNPNFYQISCLKWYFV